MNIITIKAKKRYKTKKSENQKTGKRLFISYFKEIQKNPKRTKRRLFVQESDRIP